MDGLQPHSDLGEHPGLVHPLPLLQLAIRLLLVTRDILLLRWGEFLHTVTLRLNLSEILLHHYHNEH